MRQYDQEVVDKVAILAADRMSVTQIATVLGYGGVLRKNFIDDCLDKKHPLYAAYKQGLGDCDLDLDAALQSAALSGDAKALKLAYERKRQTEIDDLKYTLFGL